MLASAFQIVGLVVLVLAASLWIPLLGIAAFGAALLVVGLVLED